MIFLPPLRERKEDILLFVDYYIKDYNAIYGKKVQGITKILERFFLNYHWEGNVRELKHIIESMVSLSDCDILEVHHLPAYMYDRIFNENITSSITNSNSSEEHKKSFFDAKDYNLKEKIEEREKEIILEVLKITKGNKTKAGELLGIPRQTLKYKIDKLNIIQ
jgi:arginine utilization regulatory protein